MEAELDALRVRPIEKSEEGRYRELMAQHHYLGDLAKIGHTLQAQGQLVEGEDRSGRDGEIFLAARAAPNLAGRAEVVPVRHAAVRADHFLPFTPAQVAEWRKNVKGRAGGLPL